MSLYRCSPGSELVGNPSQELKPYSKAVISADNLSGILTASPNTCPVNFSFLKQETLVFLRSS